MSKDMDKAWELSQDMIRNLQVENAALKSHVSELEASLNKQWCIDEAERVGKIATERAETIEIKDRKIAEIEAENVNLRAQIQAAGLK